MSNEDWFNKDKLPALLSQLEAVIVAAKAKGLKDTPAVEAVRDALAGRLAFLQGDLPEAERMFGISIETFRTMQMSKERATFATEAASDMQSAHRTDSALRFAEEAIQSAEIVWFGLSPSQRARPPRIIVNAADVAVPIAVEAHADEKAFNFIQKAKDRWFQEQLWMHEIATLPVSAAFAEAQGPSPEFDAAIQQLDAAWNAYFSGDVVDQRHDAETRVVSAYEAEALRPHRLRPVIVPTADAADCQALLGEDEALLDMFVTLPETFAALLTRHQLRVIPLGLPAKKLRDIVQAGYLALAHGQYHIGIEDVYNLPREAEWKKALGEFQGHVYASPADFLQAMHKILLAPFARELASARRLIICPHWLLHSVPFHALESTGGDPLVKTTSVTYMPSASAWRELRKSSGGPASTPLQVVVFGIERRQAPAQPTWFSKKLGQPEPLEQPSVFEDEARAVAAMYKVEPLLGPNAQKAKLLQALTTADWIHISCHAVHDRPEIFTDGLLLADGLLSVAEIATSPRLAAHPGAEVKPSVVVLSACTSGQPQVEFSDRLVSLGHGLTARLGCSVISSLWRANAESTSYLMARLHEHRKAVSDWAEALRLAQLDMLARGNPTPDGRSVDFGHPYHWANFFVLGA